MVILTSLSLVKVKKYEKRNREQRHHSKKHTPNDVTHPLFTFFLSLFVNVLTRPYVSLADIRCVKLLIHYGFLLLGALLSTLLFYYLRIFLSYTHYTHSLSSLSE
jgi:hypothetical protein